MLTPAQAKRARTGPVSRTVVQCALFHHRPPATICYRGLFLTDSHTFHWLQPTLITQENLHVQTVSQHFHSPDDQTIKRKSVGGKAKRPWAPPFSASIWRKTPKKRQGTKVPKMAPQESPSKRASLQPLPPPKHTLSWGEPRSKYRDLISHKTFMCSIFFEPLPRARWTENKVTPPASNGPHCRHHKELNSWEILHTMK